MQLLQWIVPATDKSLWYCFYCGAGPTCSCQFTCKATRPRFNLLLPLLGTAMGEHSQPVGSLSNDSIMHWVFSCRAEGRSSDSSFLAGFVMGGVVFGALGFLLAPQVGQRPLQICTSCNTPVVQVLVWCTPLSTFAEGCWASREEAA